MGGWTVRVPFLHSKSFKPSAGDLTLVLMAYCQRRVPKIRRLNELLGGTCRISHSQSVGNFADCNIFNPWIVVPWWTCMVAERDLFPANQTESSVNANAHVESVVLISKCPKLFAGVAEH
jgi:hypothetical protein